MGWQFRRSFRLGPGVRLNLGKRNASVSFGVKGAHYTTGTRGRRVTIGLPGTGLYYTQKVAGRPGRALVIVTLIILVAFIVLVALLGR
jgi:hypothetical protein